MYIHKREKRKFRSNETPVDFKISYYLPSLEIHEIVKFFDNNNNRVIQLVKKNRALQRFGCSSKCRQRMGVCLSKKKKQIKKVPCGREARRGI